MLNRRHLLQAGQGAALAALLPTGALAQDTVTLPFEGGVRALVRYPQKRPLLGLTARPPQLETPFSVFDEGPLTANDAFFVRYHLAGSPPEIDAEAWRLEIGGLVERPFSLSIANLKRDFAPVELVAVLQCSGNSRGFSTPRVGGGQSGNGNMGAARWRGVPLKAILERAGVRSGAVQVAFHGADTPPAESIPDFVKALEVAHALDGEVMLAYAMNGEDLPVLNGHPLRLVVPGWYGTYWMKHLTGVTVLDAPSDSYWMKTAYRIPDTECACVPVGTAPAATVPINKLNVRSFLTNLWFGGIKLAHLRTGFNSVNYGAKITFLDDQTTSAAGQLGMDTATGRLQVFIGGANRSVPGAHEVVGTDGANAMAADLSLGSNQITDLAPATLSTDAPTWGQVTDFVVAAVDALEWADGVTVATTE